MTKAQETRKAKIEALQAQAAALRERTETFDYAAEYGAHGLYMKNANLSGLAVLEGKIRRLQETFTKHETGAHMTVQEKVTQALAEFPEGWEVGWFNHGRTGRTYMTVAKDLSAEAALEKLREIRVTLERYILHRSPMSEIIVRRGAKV